MGYNSWPLIIPIVYNAYSVIVLCIMGIIRIGVFLYHEIIYSASLFNKLNGLGFASSFNILKQLGFIDYFMINKQLLASDYSYIIQCLQCHCSLYNGNNQSRSVYLS